MHIIIYEHRENNYDHADHYYSDYYDHGDARQQVITTRITNKNETYEALVGSSFISRVCTYAPFLPAPPATRGLSAARLSPSSSSTSSSSSSETYAVNRLCTTTCNTGLESCHCVVLTYAADRLFHLQNWTGVLGTVS